MSEPDMTHPDADLRAELERNLSMHLAIEETERKRAERAEAELARGRAARGNGVLVPGPELAKMQGELAALRAQASPDAVRGLLALAHETMRPRAHFGEDDYLEIQQVREQIRTYLTATAAPQEGQGK